MMENISPWYNIEYISGNPECGMKIYVLKNFVESCNREIDFERLNEEIGKIRTLDQELNLTISPHKDSKYLFWSINAEGSQYGFDFDENYRGYLDDLSQEKVCYLTHNVINSIQRFSIIEGFLMWARHIEIAHLKL